MFCSNCGKTIRPEEAVCPHCGASMGEDRFNGTMYTSVQARIPVDDLTKAPAGSVAYTRTDYMSEESQPQPDVYSNTTYRPLLSRDEDQSLAHAEDVPAADVPAEVAPAGEAGEQPEAAQPPVQDEISQPGDEELYTEEPAAAPGEDTYSEGPALRHVPLPEVAEGRISPEVQQFMQEFDQKQARDAEKRQSGGRRFQMPSFLNRHPAAPEQPEEEVPEAVDLEGAPEEEHIPEQPPEEQASPYAPPADAAYEDGTYYEQEEEYSDEEGEEQASPIARALSSIRAALTGNKVVRRAIAALLILAVLICGIVWLSYVTAARSKIAGVTYETYAKGTELIKGYTDQKYRDDFNETYAVNSTYARNKLAEDAAALSALVPEEPQENDEAFVQSLKSMQSVISDTLLLDAAAAKEGTTEERSADSATEWQIIGGAVSKLLTATNMSEVTSAVNMTGSAAQPTPTPAPTDPPEIYATLSKGMMDSSGVQTLQQRLIDLGYLTGKADGDFGAKTEDAVKAFQREAGLSADGIATSAVQEAIYAPDAPANPNAATATPAPEEDSGEGAPES